MKNQYKEEEKKELESFFENFQHKKRKNSQSQIQKAKNKSPFLLFCKEERQQKINENKTVSVTMLADKWNSLSSDQKEKYSEIYKKEKSLKEIELKQLQQKSFLESKKDEESESEASVSIIQQNKINSLDNFLLDFNKFLMAKKALTCHGLQSNFKN